MPPAKTLSKYVPERGHIIRLQFDPQAGREQAGTRPALVISPASYNGKTGLCIVCPITNQAKGYPFEVVLPDGIETTGVVLSDHIKSLDYSQRGAKLICEAPARVIQEVMAKLKTLLPL